MVDKNQGLLRFVQKLADFNMSMEFFQEELYWNAPQHLGGSSCTFHGIRLNEPDLGYNSHSLAFTLKNRNYDKRLHVMLNMFWNPLEFELPQSRKWRWKQVINTAAPGPKDILPVDKAPLIKKKVLKVEARSIAVALAEKNWK